MSMQAMPVGSNHEPMLDMNTTPLIDVMLVLLIMFIIAISIQTHAVKIELPGEGELAPPDPIKNKIVIQQNGAVLWNGSAVDLTTLNQYLRLTKATAPAAELHVQPDALARYERVD